MSTYWTVGLGGLSVTSTTLEDIEKLFEDRQMHGKN